MYALFEYNKIYEQGEKDGGIKELEKIKTDILRNSRAYREKLIIDVSQCEIIINSRIAELKGENKP